MRTLSDENEQILSKFDDQTSGADKRLIAWARPQSEGSAQGDSLPEDIMEQCKRLIVGQGRRTQESQSRGNILSGFEDTFFEIVYRLAEEQGITLPEVEQMTDLPEVENLVLESKGNTSAKFSSGDYRILQEKEDAFLGVLGLRVAIVPQNRPGFVIGNHGVTIVGKEGQGSTWLPLAPDVAIGLSPSEGLVAAVCLEEFVEEHNKSALNMSNSIASKSIETIEKLLAEVR